MNKYTLRFALFLLFSLQSIFAFADNVPADNAYASADYQSAVTLYQDAIDTSPEPISELYYNLGCAFFKNDQIAEALLAFERAYLIDPSDSDTKYNIELANTRTLDKITVAPTFFLGRWMDAISHWFMLNTWLALGIIFFGLAAVCFLLFLWATSRGMKMIGFYLSVFLFFLSIISNTMAYKSYRFSHDTTKAIVMAEVVTVKSSPDMSSEDLFIIHAGLKVEILQTLNNFAEILLPDKTVGWVAKNDIEVINKFVQK
ncbi:tetratricopeptide repeat protein [Porphyromonas sp.]|uniref:tetratricopeptide repeat protein n=1 Tax=Porphyromonas sp. TaxID=1924944 RepID=UPI0026DD5821|nr:tetratricopeptide repeat protein [Porphyromonas sp.]MDO4695810.1 tetratricopeptide repeat protein [Porphyromonas sp.]MDO4771410.1 tetratricopeptide repeat protein [Porphyromonas sp.]